jgi:hypothetical protein
MIRGKKHEGEQKPAICWAFDKSPIPPQHGTSKAFRGSSETQPAEPQEVPGEIQLLSLPRIIITIQNQETSNLLGSKAGSCK